MYILHSREIPPPPPGNWQYWSNLRALPTDSLFSDLQMSAEVRAWRGKKTRFRSSSIGKEVAEHCLTVAQLLLLTRRGMTGTDDWFLSLKCVCMGQDS